MPGQPQSDRTGRPAALRTGASKRVAHASSAPPASSIRPFGHDGKVARLAGGLNWFASVELLTVEAASAVAAELVPVEGIEDRFDDALAAQWQALTAPRPPLQLGERTIRLDQPQVMGIVNATPDSFSDGGQFADPAAAAEAGARMAAEGAAIIDVGGEFDPARRFRPSGKATRSSGSCRSSAS